MLPPLVLDEACQLGRYQLPYGRARIDRTIGAREAIESDALTLGQDPPERDEDQGGHSHGEIRIRKGPVAL